MEKQATTTRPTQSPITTIKSKQSTLPIPSTIEIIPFGIWHDGTRLMLAGERCDVERGYALLLLKQGYAYDPAGVLENGKSRRKYSGHVTRIRVRASFHIVIDPATRTAIGPGEHTVPVELVGAHCLDKSRIDRLDEPTDWVLDGYGNKFSPIYKGVPAQ